MARNSYSERTISPPSFTVKVGEAKPFFGVPFCLTQYLFALFSIIVFCTVIVNLVIAKYVIQSANANRVCKVQIEYLILLQYRSLLNRVNTQNPLFGLQKFIVIFAIDVICNYVTNVINEQYCNKTR